MSIKIKSANAVCLCNSLLGITGGGMLASETQGNDAEVCRCIFDRLPCGSYSPSSNGVRELVRTSDSKQARK